MATEMLWISLEGRSMTNSHTNSFTHSCYQIVRYFCRTLYFSAWVCVQNTLLYLNLTDCNKEITGTALWRVTRILLVMWMSVCISFILQCSVPVTHSYRFCRHTVIYICPVFLSLVQYSWYKVVTRPYSRHRKPRFFLSVLHSSSCDHCCGTWFIEWSTVVSAEDCLVLRRSLGAASLTASQAFL